MQHLYNKMESSRCMMKNMSRIKRQQERILWENYLDTRNLMHPGK